MPKVTIEVDVIEAKRHLQQEALESLDKLSNLVYDLAEDLPWGDDDINISEWICKIREAIEA